MAQKIKLYLDEDVDPLLATILRDRGYDVLNRDNPLVTVTV